MVELENFLVYLPLFVHMCSAVVLLPIGDGMHAFVSRATVALGLTIAASPASGVAPPAAAYLAHAVTGCLATLPVVLLLHAASSFGELLEVGRGMTIGQIVDPHYDLPEVTLAQLCRWGMFAYLAAHGVLLDSCLEAIRSGNRVVAEYPKLEFIAEMFSALWRSVSSVISAAIPLLILYLLIELFISVMSKVLPGLSLSSELFLVKGISALILLVILAQAISPELLWSLYDSMKGGLNPV